jgi:hypothetical protein
MEGFGEGRERGYRGALTVGRLLALEANERKTSPAVVAPNEIRT